MARIERLQAMRPRHATRQWLGIELCAYVLVAVSLLTVAWTNNYVSGVAVLAAWLIGAVTLGLALRGIYRRRR
jgi:hypothetical protein